MSDTLKSLREKIDALDARLVKLLSERARLAQRVGHVKKGVAVYRPERGASRISTPVRCPTARSSAYTPRSCRSAVRSKTA